MNINVFFILMIILIGIVGIVTSLLCTSKKENMFLPAIISFGLFSIIVISFMIISVIQLYKDKNINTYNIEVVRVQDTDKQNWSGIKYTDTTGNENEIVISDTKYDTDSTYIEIKRYEWWFLYEDKNVLHIKSNQGE